MILVIYSLCHSNDVLLLQYPKMSIYHCIVAGSLMKKKKKLRRILSSGFFFCTLQLVHFDEYSFSFPPPPPPLQHYFA